MLGEGPIGGVGHWAETEVVALPWKKVGVITYRCLQRRTESER